MSGREIEPGQPVTPYEALQAATVNAAYMGGLEDRLGMIAPGILADLGVLQ